MPASAADVVRPAFQHTVQQLFKPFRFGQWVRLAVTGLLAGELGTMGGCGLRFPAIPRGGNGSRQFLAQNVISRNVLLFIGIALLVVVLFLVAIVLLYVSSRMRFVLFDSVVTRECQIGRFWVARGVPALRYFAFQLLLSLAVLAGVAFIAGTAAIILFGSGWFRSPRDHIFPLILIGIVLLLLLAVFVIVAFAVSVLTKDFVVPQMALEDVTVAEGWRRLWSMLMTETAGYAGYVGMKIVLTIVAGIAVGVAVLIAVLAFLVPLGLVALIVVFGARAIGLAWNLYTMSVAIAAGFVALAAIVFGILLISVPTVVFFPAYSIYFLAARYPALSAMLYPPAPQSPGG